MCVTVECANDVKIKKQCYVWCMLKLKEKIPLCHEYEIQFTCNEPFKNLTYGDIKIDLETQRCLIELYNGGTEDMEIEENAEFGTIFLAKKLDNYVLRFMDENDMPHDKYLEPLYDDVKRNKFLKRCEKEKLYSLISSRKNLFSKSKLDIGRTEVMKYKIYLKNYCLLYTSPSPRDRQKSRMPSSA